MINIRFESSNFGTPAKPLYVYVPRVGDTTFQAGVLSNENAASAIWNRVLLSTVGLPFKVPTIASG